MDPFTPSDHAFIQEARGDMPMVRLAAYTMYFLGAVYILFGVVFAVFYSAIPFLDPSLPAAEQGFFVAVGITLGLFTGGCFGLPMVAGGVGLRQGKVWGWVVTVCVGGLFSTSLCMPFGVFLLFAMLNNDVRKAFLE